LGAVAAILLVVGLWQGVSALALPDSRVRLAQLLQPSTILAGRTAAAINQITSHDLPADPLLRAAGGLLRWGLFRSGGPQVGVGCNDWLYLLEEVRPWPDGEAAMSRRADLVAQVAERLRVQGIELLIVVVPDKARVESQTLCAIRYSAQAKDRYDAFAAMLQKRGIVPVDLLHSFRAAHAGQPLYYRTDTHWNQQGAALAAVVVAAAAGPGSDVQHFRTELTAPAGERVGDLLRLMSLDKVPESFGIRLRPTGDIEAPERTVAVDETEAGGLLDEGPAVEAVLLGSSFSANANFLGRLQQELARPVTGFARAGGGFAGAAREYFASVAFRESPPKLVIWEFPERVLGQPFGDDEARLQTEIVVPPITAGR
jgi:alginate O-acetyltransferase complex protein AlgJ